MSTEPRTAMVDVFVTKPLEIDEPSWCAGHDDDRANYKVDVTHNGPDHLIAPGGRELFHASLTQAPFSHVDNTIGLYIESIDILGTHTPDEVDQLADALTEAADQLRALGRDLARILDGGEGQ
ncbi:DUF6907 domain-containing protein [Streptomyces nigra]|uniref:DUF6907 domain-containing protein n=1 Tax=Streptomyces nigra TaxID=1827580 RepID=UPI0037D95006